MSRYYNPSNYTEKKSFFSRLFSSDSNEGYYKLDKNECIKFTEKKQPQYRSFTYTFLLRDLYRKEYRLRYKDSWYPKTQIYLIY